MRAFLYVQHLLGVGHLKRMALIARALREQGDEVMLVSGGVDASSPANAPADPLDCVDRKSVV